MKPGLFDFYSKYGWPAHRVLAKRYLTPRCKKCSISARLSPLDIDGICGLCTTPNIDQSGNIIPEEQSMMENRLRTILSEAAGKGDFTYDALVFFSGGKDSSFLLYKLKTDYPKLRLLTITIDNSFMSNTAHENIKQAIGFLGIDHITVSPNPRMYEKLFRCTFTHLSPKGSVYSIDILDGELRTDIGRHLATRYKIPLVIVGLSRGQMLGGSGVVRFEMERQAELAPRKTVTTYDVRELPLSKNETKLWWSGTDTYQDADIPHVIFPLAVWNYDEEYLKQQVVKLGLIPNRNKSPVVTNHTLIPLMAIIDMIKLGYSSWEHECTPMIRAGKADPIYWRNLFEMIEYAAKTGKFIKKPVDDILKRLDLTRTAVGLPD